MLEMAAPRWSYETPQPWEQRQGTLVDRVVRVSAEAKRIYAQQEALLPTIHHEHELDPAVGDHLQDVGKRIQILQENATKTHRKALAQKKSPQKRVVPSRFPEDTGSDGEDDSDDEDQDEDHDAATAFVQGRIETMLMDQEWDTRSWNSAKIEIAVETLYEQVEHSDDARRRDLATTMLVRLLETHESAVEHVEATIPILMNKAFRSLSKIVDMTRLFRVCTLLSVLAEWFAPILSRNNAMAKSLAFLLRETELCARIVQHHWRGVLMRRSLAARQDVDASVRVRLRSMHFIKNVELRHQFKVWRDVVGVSGLPIDALRAYVKILFHLVKPTPTAVDQNRHHVATADQARLLGSGILVVLAAFIPAAFDRVSQDHREPRRTITEHVKGIALELAECFSHDADKIIAIMKSNIIQRVVVDLQQQLHLGTATAAPLVRSCLRVVASVTKAVWQLHNSHLNAETHSTAYSYSTRSTSSTVEASYLMRQLQSIAVQFLTTTQVMETLLRVLPLAREWRDAQMCELVLSTLRSLSGSFGFRQLLEALTRNGGRALEQVILCFDWDAAPNVERAAVALFHDMTNHPHARAGFTTAGAVLMLSKWCDMGITAAKNQPRFVLALAGIALLARQHPNRNTLADSSSSGNLLGSLTSFASRLEALYSILLELVSGTSRDTHEVAVYLHQTTGVFQPILLRFLVQVKPSDMEPAFQTRKQRSISCIVLGRLFKVPALAAAAFCEATVIHVALSLQCNRLDEVEGKLRRTHSTEHDRLLHFLGLKEACKALSRLARCPSGVDVSLKPSITSVNVPLLPQAIICDVIVARMHVLEDILPLIHVPTDAAEFLDVDTAMAHAAIELIGYMRPMPYGEAARHEFLQVAGQHPHGVYANEKLEMLVTIAAPMILHVLKEKQCGRELISTSCMALSRLAATNQCRSLLLKQGAMFIALTHVPEVLYDSEAVKKRSGHSSPVKIDASVDDPGLLDVPASLFTLLAKLCAIADGRTAVLKAQVLPRVLKRLQLTDGKRRDDDLEVKSEIAVLIQRLAMCSVVEGNTSELFLHFHVVELLAQIIEELTHSLPSTAPPASHSPVKKTRTTADSQLKWRILDNIVGALAALAQDVLVCVPKIVQLDVVSRLAPLLTTATVVGVAQSQRTQQHHVIALQYHVVHVVRAIAAYPFGEYHSYLMGVRGSTLADEPRGPNGPLTFMDRVKKVAFDFTLELQGGAPVSLVTDTGESKTIGELAREVLALIRERELNEQKQRDQRQPPLQLPIAASPSRNRGPLSTPVASKSRARTPLSPVTHDAVAFPALSPKRGPPEGDSVHLSARSETPTKVTALLAPLVSPVPPNDVHPAVTIPPGVDLRSTRPPPKPETSPPPVDPHYVFARPKEKQRKQKSRRRPNHGDDDSHSLMLDPLFQSTSPTKHPRRRRTEHDVDPGLAGDEDGFAFFQEIAHQGHQVNLRARRSWQGDKYIPSLGQLQVEDPTMNVLRRR